MKTGRLFLSLNISFFNTRMKRANNAGGKFYISGTANESDIQFVDTDRIFRIPLSEQNI